jgi:uncharacterized protein YuzE
MSDPTISVEIDPHAGLVYVQLSANTVVKTDGFGPEINVDLDEFGVAVGIESMVPAELDVALITRLAAIYHIASEVVDLLPMALQVVQDFTHRQSTVTTASSEFGVLHPASSARLAPCA